MNTKVRMYVVSAAVIAALAGCGSQAQGGAAGHPTPTHPAGTPVHAVKGFSPRCRLAAYMDGKPRTYVAVNNTKHGPVFRACAKVASVAASRSPAATSRALVGVRAVQPG